MGLLVEVIDALELEHSLEAVPSAELAADLRKLAVRVSYHFVIPFCTTTPNPRNFRRLRCCPE